MQPIIPYGRQSITQADIDGVIETLKSDYLTQGPKVVEFEKKLAEYVGASYAVALSNGTVALHLAMMALGVGPKQKILTTPNSFAATSNAALYLGAEVEFIDIDEKTFNIDLELLDKKLQENPGKYHGIAVVDFAGYPVDLEKVRALADRHMIWVIEDACHAIGAQFKTSAGRWAKAGDGSFADFTVFSFHPVKHVSCGEGGALTTNSKELYNRVMLLRTHGITKDPARMIDQSRPAWYHEMQELGYNFRLTDIQSSLGITQLAQLDASIERRREIAAFYKDSLHGLGIKLPEVDENSRHAFHLYVIRTKRRDELYSYLKSKGIYTMVHYIPIYRHPYYQKLGFEKGLCPKDEAYYEECLSLPMYPSITTEQLAYVVSSIRSFFQP